MFNYDPDYPITAFKSLNSNQPKWEIIDYFDGKPFKGIFPVGAVISSQEKLLHSKVQELFLINPRPNTPPAHV